MKTRLNRLHPSQSTHSSQSKISVKSKISIKSKKSIKSLLALLTLLASCSIEPQLRIWQDGLDIVLPVTVTDLKAVWGVDADWEKDWWYGWDTEDMHLWGNLEYPEPTYFEVRRFFQGETQMENPKLEDGFTIYSTSFRRYYRFGYYNLLLWSNIDSDDGTQTVLIDESDYNNIIGTTTKTTVSYARNVSNRTVPLKNQPDVFYNVHERDLYISHNTEDYDYYDPVEDSWVKVLNATLTPVVYIYLVQVVVYNNNGKITGLADNATLQNMSEGVNLNTGHTLLSNVDVVFAMRQKSGLPARDGRTADIIGGKFTTFGLCDIEGWLPSRGPMYTGSRADLRNELMLDFRLSNARDSVFTYDMTPQLQSKIHGGVLTIEIDADTIKVPEGTDGSGAGFLPTVEDYDKENHYFDI